MYKGYWKRQHGIEVLLMVNLTTIKLFLAEAEEDNAKHKLNGHQLLMLFS